MATVFNNLEGGTASNAVTTGNAGGRDNNLFDTATISGTSTAIFDATHARGSMAVKMTTAADNSTIRLGWTSATLSTFGEGWVRFYVYFTSNPSASIYLSNIITQSGNNAASLMLTSTGKLRLEDNNGVQQGITTNSISLNQWVRIEFHAIQNATNGTMDVWLYNTPDAALGSHTETVHTTTGPTGGGSNYDAIWVGSTQNIASVQGPWWVDEIAGSTTAQIGPAEIAATGTGVVGTISAYGGNVVPNGWLLCDGTSYLKASYTALDAVLSAASYPYGSDSTHFNVPDLRQRFPFGGGGPNEIQEVTYSNWGTGESVLIEWVAAGELEFQGSYSAATLQTIFDGAIGSGNSLITMSGSTVHDSTWVRIEWIGSNAHTDVDLGIVNSDGTTGADVAIRTVQAPIGVTGGSVDHTHTGPSHTHGVTQPADHTGHSVTQASAHTNLVHQSSAATAHAAGFSHSGFAVTNDHTVSAEAGTHATHAAASGTGGTHTHDAHPATANRTTGGANMGITATTAHSDDAAFSGNTHDAHPAHSGSTINTHAAAGSITQASAHSADSHSVTEASSHSSITHTGATATGAHTHSGAATTGGGTGASGTGNPPFQATPYIIRAT